jgi:hypothetical protein
MNSLASTDPDEFMRTEGEALSKLVFPEAFFQRIGKKHEYTKEVLVTLTKGQQSVFMFMTVYHHNVCGWNLFLYGLSSRIEEGLFDKLKSGLEYLGDKKLLDILLQVEERYLKEEEMNPDKNTFEDLDAAYEKIKNESLMNAAGFIKNHPDEFVIFKIKDS